MYILLVNKTQFKNKEIDLKYFYIFPFNFQAFYLLFILIYYLFIACKKPSRKTLTDV